MARYTILVFILTANIIPIFSVDPSDIPLPQIYSSIAYQLDLYLPPKLFTSNNTEFSGKVNIRLLFAKKTDQIQLHSHHRLIKFENITFGNDTLNENEDYTHDDVNDIVNITLRERTAIGTQYDLAFEFTGNINTEDSGAPNGLYKSSYVNRHDVTKYFMVTQFAPSYARTVFPCFDDPAFKATFNVSITFPTGLDVIFNTEEVSRHDEDGLTRVHFKTTPRMSTYLLAFVVSDFTCTTGTLGDRVRFRVCSRDELANKRNLALKMTPKLLAKYNDYINYNYSRALGKLDIVALPDYGNKENTLLIMSRENDMVADEMIALPYFHPGVTENWGLIIHSENELLYDKGETSSQKQTVTLTISHELAHQWFGNLVTFNWWSEVFISKGLAALFETHITDKVIPEWEVEKQFVVNCLHEALVHDAFDNVIPPHTFYGTTYASDIDRLLTKITYNKGGIVMRMVQHFMGVENFRTGIQHYVNKHKFGNVETNDLWKALDEIIADTGFYMPANLSTIMKSWIADTGYPMLNVSLSNGIVTVIQWRFLYHRYHLANGQYKWYIPISYTLSNDQNKFMNTMPNIWMTPDHENLSFPLFDNTWIVLNNQQTGYYRVFYETELINAIKLALEEGNFGGITEINRAQLVDDLFSFARATVISYKNVLQFVRFLQKDTSYYTWKAAMEGFGLLLRRFGYNSEIGEDIKADVLKLMENMYKSVSIIVVKEDDQIYTLKQQLALDWACKLGHKNCIKDVREMFRQFKFSEYFRPKPNLAYIVYCNGLRHSNDFSDWDFVWNVYKRSEPSEQEAIRLALACSRNQSLLETYLDESITEGSGFKFIDVMIAFIQTENNPEATEAAYNFLFENEEYIISSFRNTTIQYIFEAIGEKMEPLVLTEDMKQPSRLMREFRESAYKAYRAAKAVKFWVERHHDEVSSFYSMRESVIFWGDVWSGTTLVFVILGIMYWVFKERIRNNFSQLMAWLRRRFRRPQEDMELQRR